MNSVLIEAVITAIYVKQFQQKKVLIEIGNC